VFIAGYISAEIVWEGGLYYMVKTTLGISEYAVSVMDRQVLPLRRWRLTDFI
jgi:hypothetical protein